MNYTNRRRYVNIDPVAVQRLVELSPKKDAALLCELVTLFTAEFPPTVAQMRALLASKDFAGLVKAAHTFKTSAANLGAVAIHDLVEKIEKNPHAAEVDGYLDSLDHEFPIVIEELRNLINKYTIV